MKTVSVKNKWLSDSDLRLDASFHLSDGVKTRRIIDKLCPYPKVPLKNEAAELFKGNIHKRVYVTSPENGLMFYTASDMFKSDLNTGKYISKKYSPYLKELELKKDWILITRSGTLGKVFYTSQDYEGTIGTDDLVRIKPAEKQIKRGFLYAYLSSKYGYGLLTQSGYGGVVKHIEPHHIEILPIPILPHELQLKIHKLIVEANDLRVKANLLLGKAINLINDEIGILSKRSYTGKAKISDLKSNYNYRLDAPVYINQGVTDIKNLLQRKNNVKSISELNFKVTRPGIFKRVKVDAENGLPYLKGSELGRVNPFASCEYLSKTKTPFLDELELYENQILFTCAGTVGDIKLISKEFKERNAIGSQDIIRINGEGAQVSIFYLFAYLKSSIVKEFIQSLKYGSVIERVEPFHVGMIPVFNVSQENYKTIVKNVIEYKDLMYLSFKNEETAIEMTEKEIESWQK